MHILINVCKTGSFFCFVDYIFIGGLANDHQNNSNGTQIATGSNQYGERKIFCVN